jgi:hypothetical protein
MTADRRKGPLRRRLTAAEYAAMSSQTFKDRLFPPKLLYRILEALLSKGYSE